MTEDVDVKALKGNPELFRILLKNAVEEVASGMCKKINKSILQSITVIFVECSLGYLPIVPIIELSNNINIILTPHKYYSNKGTPEVFQNQVELLQEGLKASIFPLIDDMWSKLEINQKFLCLNQLKEKYPVDYVAWRPADDIPMQTLKGNYLTQMKERLLHETEKYKNEENELKKQLIAKGAALRKSLREIKKAEEVVADLYNYYEKSIQMNIINN